MILMNQYKNKNVLYDLNQKVLIRSTRFTDILKYVEANKLNGQFYFKFANNQYANIILIQDDRKLN